MRWILSFGLLTAAACGQPSPMPCGGTGGFGGSGGGFSSGSLDAVGVTGTAQHVTLALPLLQSCPGGNPKADEVVVEVLDPTNQPIAHTETAPQSDSFSGPSTTVTFTPTAAGSYHLSARFEPGLGRAQSDVEVAVDRSGAAVTALSLPTTCEQFEQLPSGVLCRLVGTLLLYQNQVKTQQWDAEEFAVSGSVLWVLSNSRVSRWVDTGAATLTNTSAGFGPTTDVSGSRTLIASADAVVVAGASSAQVFHSVTAGVVSDPLQSFPYVGQEFVAVVDPGFTAALVVGSERYCPVMLGASAAPACVEAIAHALGADATGVWTLEGTTIRHRSFDATVSAPLKTASLPLLDRPLTDSTALHFQSAPVLWTSADHTRQLVLVRTATGILFEQYPKLDGFALVSGTAATVRAQNSAGAQRLFTR